VSKKPPVSEEDAALFRNAAGGAMEIPQERASIVRRRPKPQPRLALRERAPAAAEQAPARSIRAAEHEGEQLFVRPGLQQKLVRRLRRGQIPVADEADLHGMRIHQAQSVLEDFLSESRERGLRCVRVIHGKGLGSRDGRAVLKWEVDRLLRAHSAVMAFCSAQPRDGGTGAVYVLLKA
jgi:DNA-nicking Smr family endonuclease